MVFPSSQVEFRATRLPWLSAGLVLVSFWVLLAIPAPLSFEERDPKAALQAAFRYWQAHGYLNADHQTIETARVHFDPGSASVAIAVIQELGRRGMPDDETQRGLEQATLDGLALAARPVPDSANPLAPNHALRVYGFTPASPTALTAATHLFLYAGWIHFLAIVPLCFFLGASAEDRFGKLGFALFTLFACIVSTATHLLLEPDSPMSLIGAAGPTAALLAIFSLRHRMQPVRVVALAPRNGDGDGYGLRLVPFALSAIAIPIYWLVINLALTLWLDAIGVRNDLSISAVAGGLGFGLLAGMALRRFDFEPAYLGPELYSKIRSGRERSGVDKALVARDIGDIDRAYGLVCAEAKRTPGDPEVTRLLWNLALSSGKTEAAAPVVVLQIQRLIHRGDFLDAVDFWCELVKEMPNQRLSPDDLVRIVPILLANQRIEFAVTALRHCVDAPTGELSIGLALKLLDLAEALDPFTALLAARRVLELPDLHETKRTRILALVRELDPAEVTLPELPTPELELDTEIACEPEIMLEPDILFPDEVTDNLPGDEHGVEQRQLVAQPDLSSLPRFDGIQPVAAVPTRLTNKVLYFRLDDGRKAKVRYPEIQALAVAAVRDVSSKPVVVIDLLLNWTELSDAPLRSIRLRSDQFDPAQLVPPVGTPTANLRSFLAELQHRSQALPLPDADAVLGQPFTVFKFLRSYQRRVLKVDC